MSTHTKIGVVNLPGMADALSDAGYDVVSADLFRTAAQKVKEVNSQRKLDLVLVGDVHQIGLKGWATRMAAGMNMVVVTTPDGGTFDSDSGLRLLRAPLPAWEILDRFGISTPDVPSPQIGADGITTVPEDDEPSSAAHSHYQGVSVESSQFRQSELANSPDATSADTEGTDPWGRTQPAPNSELSRPEPASDIRTQMPPVEDDPWHSTDRAVSEQSSPPPRPQPASDREDGSPMMKLDEMWQMARHPDAEEFVRRMSRESRANASYGPTDPDDQRQHGYQQNSPGGHPAQYPEAASGQNPWGSAPDHRPAYDGRDSSDQAVSADTTPIPRVERYDDPPVEVRAPAPPPQPPRVPSYRPEQPEPHYQHQPEPEQQTFQTQHGRQSVNHWSNAPAQTGGWPQQSPQAQPQPQPTAGGWAQPNPQQSPAPLWAGSGNSSTMPTPFGAPQFTDNSDMFDRAMADQVPDTFRSSDSFATVCITAAGKGGVGKTSTAILIAQKAAAAGYRVIVIDGNRGQAGVGVRLRLKQNNLPTIADAALTGNIEDAFLTPTQINDARRGANLEEIKFGLIQAPPPSKADPRLVTNEVYARAIAYAKQRADLVLIDTQIVEAMSSMSGTLFKEVLVPMLRANDPNSPVSMVVVTEHGRESYNNTAARLPEFQRSGIPRNRIMLLLNMAEPGYQRSSLDSLKWDSFGQWVGIIDQDPLIKQTFNSGRTGAELDNVSSVIDHTLFCITGDSENFQSHRQESAHDSSRARGGNEHHDEPRKGLFGRLFSRR